MEKVEDADQDKNFVGAAYVEEKKVDAAKVADGVSALKHGVAEPGCAVRGFAQPTVHLVLREGPGEAPRKAATATAYSHSARAERLALARMMTVGCCALLKIYVMGIPAPQVLVVHCLMKRAF